MVYGIAFVITFFGLLVRDYIKAKENIEFARMMVMEGLVLPPEESDHPERPQPD